MPSTDVHEQLMEAYEAARLHHRQLLERFLPTASYGHGQRYENPAARPTAADLEELATREAAMHAAHAVWVASFGRR